MQDYFQAPYPARSTIEVSGLPKGANFEVDAVMVIDCPPRGTQGGGHPGPLTVRRSIPGDARWRGPGRGRQTARAWPGHPAGSLASPAAAL
ncbi:hypothetical protein G6F68_014544 [Rhizopus microsporus]|nr:hypothetical protein G6F68_014544 [Rhizopus microsporus]